MEDLYALPFDYDGKGTMPETEFVDDGVGADPLPEMNKDEALPNKKEAVLRADTSVHATLKTLRGHLQNLRSPDGSKTNPAKTCQDIRQCYPQKKSGEGPSRLCRLFSAVQVVLIPYLIKLIDRVVLVTQENTGSIQTKEAQRTPSGSSVIWKMVRPASLLLQPTFPTSPGGQNPVPAPTNQSGSEPT